LAVLGLVVNHMPHWPLETMHILLCYKMHLHKIGKNIKVRAQRLITTGTHKIMAII